MSGPERPEILAPSAIARTWDAILREPFRLLFPLGALLGAVGVGHWIAFAAHVTPYPGPAHAIVQAEAFLFSFGAGFLLTMMSRRAGVERVPAFTVVGIALALVAVTVLASREHPSAAQVAYLVALALLVARALRLARAARPPAAFALVPVGLLLATIGSLLLLAQPWIHAAWPSSLGRWLVGEACWLCIALGVGHLILPVLTGHAPHPARGGPLAHALVGLGIGATFVVQQVASSDRLGTALRGAILAWEIAGCMRALRPPRLGGTHRTLAWLSFWMLPAGEILAAIAPSQRVGLLHVAFIGGFSLMTFSVATHVIASHGGFDELVTRRSGIVRVIGGLVILAMLTRAAAGFLPAAAYWSHLAFAAIAWMVALAAWTAFLLPKTWNPRRTEHEVVKVELPG